MNNLITRLKQKPPEKQEALASKFLSEMDDEEKWEQAFNQTTEKQWAKLADDIKNRIENEELLSVEDVFDTEK
jgi:hypoxanthine-guanine phosphoribosyltransferase